MTESSMVKVPLEDVYRLLNIGATVLVSAEHEGVADVMPAAWACALDLLPAKATVVVDKTHFTRPLMEKSGYFALELPTAAIARETLYLGSVSKNDESDKLEKSDAVIYIGIAADEPNRFHNLSETKKSPLVEAGWDEAYCRKWCEENGLLSPIYTTSTRGAAGFATTRV